MNCSGFVHAKAGCQEFCEIARFRTTQFAIFLLVAMSSRIFSARFASSHSDIRRILVEIPALKKTMRREIRAEIRRTFAGAEGADRKSAAERKLVESLDLWYSETSRPGQEGLWAFWPTLPEEPDFRHWLRRLMSQGVPIGLPRLDWNDRILDFRKVEDPERDLEFDSRGLAEPRAQLPLFGPGEVTRILVPGLAFDLSGHRLGRGAGFYDRTLEGVAATVTTVGIAFDLQVVERVPTDEYDRNVQWLLTPQAGLRQCREDHAH